MRRRRAEAAAGALLAGALSGAAAPAEEQARLEPAIVNRASVSGQAQIGRLLEALDLVSVDPAAVERIDVYDLTRNGFGAGDVVHVHPTEELRVLVHVGAEMRAEMERWSGGAQREQHFSPRVEPDSLEALRDPRAAIAAGTMRAVERNYGRGQPFGLLLTSDGEERAVFEMWGYRPDSLHYRPPAAGAGRASYDLVDVVRRQTEVIADRVAYDLLYIHATSTDTLFLPAPPDAAEEADDEGGFLHPAGAGDAP